MEADKLNNPRSVLQTMIVSLYTLCIQQQWETVRDMQHPVTRRDSQQSWVTVRDIQQQPATIAT